VSPLYFLSGAVVRLAGLRVPLVAVLLSATTKHLLRTAQRCSWIHGRGHLHPVAASFPLRAPPSSWAVFARWPRPPSHRPVSARDARYFIGSRTKSSKGTQRRHYLRRCRRFPHQGNHQGCGLSPSSSQVNGLLGAEREISRLERCSSQALPASCTIPANRSRGSWGLTWTNCSALWSSAWSGSRSGLRTARFTSPGPCSSSSSARSFSLWFTGSSGFTRHVSAHRL